MQVVLAPLEIALLLRRIIRCSAALDAFDIVQLLADIDALGEVVGRHSVVSPCCLDARC